MRGDLKTDLAEQLTGRTAWLGIGNPELGDDGFGVRLAEALQAAGHPDVILAGTTPEHWAAQLAEGRFKNVVLLDAVTTGAAPGAVVFWDAGELKSRFPQVSTHRVALGTLARLMGAGGARVWLLGVQPATLQSGSGLSSAVRETLEVLQTWLLAGGATATPGAAG